MSKVNALRNLRPAPRGMSAMLVVAMLLFAQTCAQHGGACAGAFGERSHTHSAVNVDPDRCADHDGGCADHDGCGASRQDCSHGSICCSTWAPAPATLSLQSPPAVPAAFALNGSLLQPSAALASAPAPIPRGSP